MLIPIAHTKYCCSWKSLHKQDPRTQPLFCLPRNSVGLTLSTDERKGFFKVWGGTWMFGFCLWLHVGRMVGALTFSTCESKWRVKVTLSIYILFCVPALSIFNVLITGDSPLCWYSHACKWWQNTFRCEVEVFNMFCKTDASCTICNPTSLQLRDKQILNYYYLLTIWK